MLSLSLAALVGPEAACGRVSWAARQSYSDTQPWGETGFWQYNILIFRNERERGTISYLIERVVKDGLWKNLFVMKQNESLNPVLLTLPPEITELCWDNPLATKKVKGGKVSNSGMNCGSFRLLKGLPSITKHHFCQGLCYMRCSCPSSGPLSFW